LLDDRQRLAYLHLVLTNAFLRGLRRRWMGEIAAGDLPHGAAVDETDALVLRASAVAAVRRLPPRQRAVIALRYLAGADR
jgi:DNA-directed RNA polymerase specialized sigma24 family protein